MALETTLITLIHLMVFAYWLGGDIGVFYASTLLTDDKRDTAGRLTAGKIVNDVDLAPRFCLLMTLPTGLTLAVAQGWMLIDLSILIAIASIAVGWCWVLWRLHIDHRASQHLRSLDILMRYLFLSGLVIIGGLGLVGVIAIPLFIAIKFLLLGFAISMGLYVRHVLKPFGAAFGALAAKGPSKEINATINLALRRARPAVIMIWITLIIAGWLGVAAPT